MNPCIATYYMPNISRKTIELHSQVVDKFNKSKIAFYSIKGQIRHGHFIDYFWKMNGVVVPGFEEVEVQDNLKMNHDVIIFLDIDCIPLNYDIFDYMIEEASKGKIIGNVQRSGHIENGNHLFSAPSATAISKETFSKIGRPSAIETPRSDVMEEYTWAADSEIEIEYFIPSAYARPPHRYDWETDQRPYWTLENGLPNYGIGTTYKHDKFGDVFYHNFQIREKHYEELFWEHCELALNK